MARKNKSKTVYLSAAGQVAVNKELAELIARRPEMIELINASKELGSSDDNADLDEVRRQQGFLEGRIEELQALLHEAEIITVPKTRSKIMLGSTVELSSAEGPDTYTIVGRAEANPARGLISNESPLGLALLGHKVAETIVIKAPAGEFSYKIEKIDNLAGPIAEPPLPLAAAGSTVNPTPPLEKDEAKEPTPKSTSQHKDRLVVVEDLSTEIRQPLVGQKLSNAKQSSAPQKPGRPKKPSRPQKELGRV
jgi:transcription elongation factor GreA